MQYELPDIIVNIIPQAKSPLAETTSGLRLLTGIGRKFIQD